MNDFIIMHISAFYIKYYVEVNENSIHNLLYITHPHRWSKTPILTPMEVTPTPSEKQNDLTNNYQFDTYKI